jgi:hypothetical protein
MQMFWTEDRQGTLIAAMGVVFVIGLGFLRVWFKRAGLLATP